ncbi:ROK family protein [Oceanicola sp. S124]|uniref:ROK family protein n=1 Tax=Oceanicola sp. S124 TaxID=1042378 RepID=UPI0002559128|nr:ROK family protein [Oceanicola sp. S124]
MFPRFDLPLTSIQKDLLRRLALDGPQKRAGLIAESGLSPQTIMRAIAPLRDGGVLREIPIRIGERGQPARELRLIPGQLCLLGISVAEFEVSVCLRDLAGTIFYREKAQGDLGHPDEALACLERMLDAARDALPEAADCLGGGIAAQGFMIEPGRRLAARGGIAAWSRLDLHARLEELTGLPLALENDSRALALCVADRVRDLPQNAFFVHLSSGIGGGQMLSGRPVRGAWGNAGSVGGLIPRGPDRPTETRIRAAFGVSDWRELPQVSQAQYQAGMDWLDRAAAQLSPALQAIWALMDPAVIYLLCPLPAPIAEALIARVSLVSEARMSTLAGLDPAQLHLPDLVPWPAAEPDIAACIVAREAALAAEGWP